MHTHEARCADPSTERVTLIWAFELLQCFLTRQQLCLLFLLANRKDAHIATSCCTCGQRQGHAGGIIAGTKQELPIGSCVIT